VPTSMEIIGHTVYVFNLAGEVWKIDLKGMRVETETIKPPKAANLPRIPGEKAPSPRGTDGNKKGAPAADCRCARDRPYPSLTPLCALSVLLL
jgi:hypothetical protein